MKKLSKHQKLNKVLNAIYEDLQEMGMDEVLRYRGAFKREKDYNIAQYGNMLIYYDDVRKLFKEAGYKSVEKMSDGKVWDIYLRLVGYVVDLIFLWGC